MLEVAVNLAVNGSSLLFLIFMMVIYFSKKNMNNIDNTLYKLLLVFNFLNSFIHIFFLLAQWFGICDINTIKLLIRGYWIPNQCFGVVLIFYVFLALKGENKEFIEKLNNNKKTFFLLLLMGCLLVTCLMSFSPFDITFTKENTVENINGLATVFFSITFIVLLILIIITLIVNRNIENKKKMLPFKVLLVFIIGGFTLGFMYPMICITEFLLTIISYLMFHTIENPDLKLVNQLTLAKNEAEKASNAKSEFLSSMSHELRTPLNAIVGLSTMIKDNSTDPDSRNDAADIYKASSNLLELVDGILDVNKLESNQMEIVENKYNLRDVLDSVVRSANIRIGNKQLELKTSFSEDIPNYLYGDSEKIKIILNQLLSNAVKYTESGFIKLSVDAFTNKDKCNLTFTVSDTGRGIPEDKIENLFTKFYRLDEDKDSDIEGTGLGLSITKSLVELLNGKVSVNSVYGEGSTFTVTISQMVFIEDNNTEIL
ncbi:MAG: ATP-binding protein [Bacilli bacterium]|nr:ATP-binding protein [Bacilli bacterium]